MQTNQKIQSLEDFLLDVQNQGLKIKAFKIDHQWHSFQWGPDDHRKKGSYKAVQTSQGTHFYFKNWKEEALSFEITLGTKLLTEQEMAEHKKESPKKKKPK